MRKFTLVPVGESWSAPGGRQLVGQTANLTFESACRLLYAAIHVTLMLLEPNEMKE